jgi:hypothetical protein
MNRGVPSIAGRAHARAWLVRVQPPLATDGVRARSRRALPAGGDAACRRQS